MRYLAALAVCLSPLLAEAGSYIVIASGDTVPVPAVLDVPAEYVGVSVYIRSAAKDAAKRIDEVNETRVRLNRAVSANPNLQIQWARSSYSAAEGSDKFSSYSGADSQSQMFVLGKLGSAGIDAVTKQIISAIKTVEAVGDASITTGDTRLGVTDPERFRKKLLGLIKDNAGEARTALGGSSLEISGVGSPVQVVQKNDKEVSLFINYRVTVKK